MDWLVFSLLNGNSRARVSAHPAALAATGPRTSRVPSDSRPAGALGRGDARAGGGAHRAPATAASTALRADATAAEQTA